MATAETENKAELSVDPIEILEGELRFYKEKADTLADMILTSIKVSGKYRGDQLVQMYKMMGKNREMVVKIATELAPYAKPKLQSIETKSSVEHRFVVRAPEQIPDTDKFLEATGMPVKPPVIIDQDKSNLNFGNRINKKKPIEFSDAELVSMAEDSLTQEKKHTDGQIFNFSDYVPPEDRLD